MKQKRKRRVRVEKRKQPNWISWEEVDGHREMRVIGLPVKMAKRPIPPFVLTEAHIEKAGRSKDFTGCNMALCLKQTQHFDFTAVTKNIIYAHRPGAKFVERYPTPQAIRENVVIPNDTGGRVEPGKFNGVPIFAASTQAKYESRSRQGGKSKGARDRGSKDRTPSHSRLKPIVLRGVRQLSV